MEGESKRFVEIETSSTPEGAINPIAKPIESKKPESNLTPGRVSLEQELKQIGGVLEIHVTQAKRDGSIAYKGPIQMNTETETKEDIYNKTLRAYGSGIFHFKCRMSDGKDKEWKQELDNPVYPNTFDPKIETKAEEPVNPVPVSPVIQPTNDKSLEVMANAFNSLVATISNKGGDPEIMAEVKKLKEKVEGRDVARYSDPNPIEDSPALDGIMMEIRELGARIASSEMETQKRIEDDKKERKDAEQQKKIDDLEKKLVELKTNPPAATESMSDTILKVAELLKPAAKDGFTLDKLTPFIPFLTPLLTKVLDQTSSLEKGIALAMQISGGGEGSGSTDWSSVLRGFAEKAGGKAIENLDPQLISGILAAVAGGKQPPVIPDMTKNPELAQPATKPAIEPKVEKPKVEPKPKAITGEEAVNVVGSLAVRQSLDLIKQGKTEEAAVVLLRKLPLENSQELANSWNKTKEAFTYIDKGAKKYAKEIKSVHSILKEQFVEKPTPETEKLKSKPKVEKPEPKKKKKKLEKKVKIRPVSVEKPEVKEDK